MHPNGIHFPPRTMRLARHAGLVLAGGVLVAAFSVTAAGPAQARPCDVGTSSCHSVTVAPTTDRGTRSYP